MCSCRDLETRVSFLHARWHPRQATLAAACGANAPVATAAFRRCLRRWQFLLLPPLLLCVGKVVVYNLRICTARWRECVYVLQSVFLFFFCFLLFPSAKQYETTVLGNG